MRAPGWKVVLVVEDNSDGEALRALLQKRYPALSIDWLPANGIGNIKRNGGKLIRLAQDRIPARGCAAVVVDRDGLDPAADEPLRTIAAACRQAGVPLLLCREAMEACFLADPGCCAWLGIPVPTRSDTVPDPKERVSRAFLQKTRRTYQKRRARLEVARRGTGPDPARNETVREAWELLDRCAAS